MKKISLSIGERFALMGLINNIGRGVMLKELRLGIKIQDRVEVDTDERKLINFREEESGSFRWDDKSEKEFEFSDDEIKHINEVIDSRDKTKTFNQKDGINMINLIDKIPRDV